jgi:flagellar biosynthesis protein FliP
MDRLELRLNKPKLVFYIILVTVVVLASTYFLFKTNQYPTLTKILGTIAALVLVVFVLRPTIKNLWNNDPQIIADREKISFKKKDNWKEFKWIHIKHLDFNKYYDRYKIRKVINLETHDGKKEELILNDLDFKWDELTKQIKELKSGLS